MRLPMTPLFRQEWERWDLRFCCEDCAHLDRNEQTCAHGWPDAEHRRAYYESPACKEVIFCKEFELI